MESTRLGSAITFVVDATDDESGIDQVWFTYNWGGSEWVSEPMSRNPETTRWEFSIDRDAHVPVQFFVQVVDRAGNVSHSNNKGIYHIAEMEKLYLPIVLRSYSP